MVSFSSAFFSLITALFFFPTTLFSLPFQSQMPHTVYITVDDGPLGATDNILTVLQEENVSATFFMVGEHITASSDHQQAFMRAKKSPLVLLANHSFTHAHDHYQFFYSDPAVVLADMQKNNQLIGFVNPPFYARLPGRDVFRLPSAMRDDHFITPQEDQKERPDFDELYQSGFWLYGWDIEWAHRTDGTPVQSIEQLMLEISEHFKSGKSQIPGHLILLTHEQMFTDHHDGTTSFRALVKALKAAGYSLKTVDKYPGNDSPGSN